MEIKLRNERRVIEYDGVALVEESPDTDLLKISKKPLDRDEVEELIGALRCWLNIGRLPIEEVGG